MRTRKLLLVIAILSVMVVLAVGSAQGAPAAPAGTYTAQPNADAYVRNTGETFNSARLSVYATNPPQPPLTCTPRDVTYLKFNLGALGIPAGQTISGATLTLSVQEDAPVAPCSGTLPMAIKGSSKDDWSENTADANGITWSMHESQMNLGAVLASASSACVGTVSFTGADLAKFLDGQKGGEATLAITSDPSLTCGSDSTLYQYLRSKESATGAKPLLTITSTPNAVTLSSFSSADPAVNWPLIAGLGALAAVVVGGLAVSRRRAARG